MKENVNIYTIYASKDTDAMQKILQLIKPYEQHTTIWSDNPIEPGQQWKSSDITRQDKTDIFLLLISNAFMYSQFVKQLEFKKVIDRYKAGKSTVIPVILEDCPWEIDFEADEYTFRFKELQVLPEGAKPVSDWESSDKAFESAAEHINNTISSISRIVIKEDSTEISNENEVVSEVEDQLAIPFSAEEAEAKNEKVEEERIKAEAQAKIETAEKDRIKLETETKRKAEEEKTLLKEAADKKRAEEEKIKEEKEIERLASVERKLQEAADKKLEEEKRQKEEKEAERLAAVERKLQEEAAEAEEVKRIQEELERRKAQAEQEKMIATESSEEVEEIWEEENKNAKRRILVGVSIAALALIGIFLFSGNDSEVLENPIPALNEKTVVVEETTKENQPDASEAPKKVTRSAAASMSKFEVGDSYESGIIFMVDGSGQSGKMAHIDDVGPMTWKDAMKITEELGEGWRLPTFDELQLMYKTIGQGASNNGEFADELYWSATPYDANQARLVRFRDGNTSYHYNSRGTHRKYRARAIREFTK